MSCHAQLQELIGEVAAGSGVGPGIGQFGCRAVEEVRLAPDVRPGVRELGEGDAEAIMRDALSLPLRPSAGGADIAEQQQQRVVLPRWWSCLADGRSLKKPSKSTARFEPSLKL